MTNIQKIAIAILTSVTIAAGADFALAQTAPMVNGQVTKVDQSAKKITIKHEAIPNLDMQGGMTMVFVVQDPEILRNVKPGDRMRFSAERVNGVITVTRIQK
jgi:Cu(I)/Ag(I) efflux system protein CusF